jgi:tetratricopeptide (TPR) repeat protein
VSTEAPLPDLAGLPDTREAVAADAGGRLLGNTGEREEAARAAARTATTIRELAGFGGDAALGTLDMVVTKGPSRTTVTVVRAALFVQATVDPTQGTIQIERALGEWNPTAAGVPGTTEEELAVSPVDEELAVGAEDLASSLAAAASQSASPRTDAWASLRRTLVRGQLTEASTLRGALIHDPATGAPRAGAEPLDPAARDRAVDALLEGIGCALSGDAVGGLRTLKEVASAGQRNLSFRWLALHWSALAALQCNNAQAARWFARQSGIISRQLDLEAQAVSHWAAAEVLMAEGDGQKALDWIAQARVRFEGLGDTWGLGRACFAEARILGAMGREEEAVEAARRAWFYDAAWDDPAVFLSRRALQREALDEAEELLRMVTTAPAERMRLVVQAVRQGGLAHEDAIELLRHLDAAPSPDAARALDTLARGSPRLPVPREALAWMLLKAGRYADAGKHFTALAGMRLPPAIRSSVMLGLGCVAHAQQTGERPEARLRAAVEAGDTATSGASATADPGSTPPPTGLGSSVPLANGGSVFSGKLSVFAVPDLLEFLRGARRTGLLLCSGPAGTAALRFRDGRIGGAASPATPGVGEILIRARKLSAVVLKSVLERQDGRSRSDGMLGERLVREGLVEADDVKRALREQIGLAIREIIGWRDGEFAFNREEATGEAEIHVEVDPQEVLLNALKELDEASRTDATT